MQNQVSTRLSAWAAMLALGFQLATVTSSNAQTRAPIPRLTPYQVVYEESGKCMTIQVVTNFGPPYTYLTLSDCNQAALNQKFYIVNRTDFKNADLTGNSTQVRIAAAMVADAIPVPQSGYLHPVVINEGFVYASVALYGSIYQQDLPVVFTFERPSPAWNWIPVGKESDYFDVFGPRTVRYGVPGRTYFERELSGRNACVSATFGGDPVPNMVKACEIKVPQSPLANFFKGGIRLSSELAYGSGCLHVNSGGNVLIWALDAPCTPPLWTVRPTSYQ